MIVDNECRVYVTSRHVTLFTKHVIGRILTIKMCCFYEPTIALATRIKLSCVWNVQQSSELLSRRYNMAKTRTFVATQRFKLAFLASAGQPPVPWERCVAMFEDWLLAIGFPTGDEYKARKAAILRASLGTKGYQIYLSLASNLREDYASATQRLEDHFV